MTRARATFEWTLASVVLACATGVAAQNATAPTPLPGRSLYHATAALTDQRGAKTHLGVFRGRPVLIAMFYSSCKSVCPVILAQLQRIEAALPPDVRADTRVLLVSLDPRHDTPNRLAALAKRLHVDENRWRLARTSTDEVQEIAALLGVSFRRMPNGEIDHASLVALLDREGVIVNRLEGAFAEPSALIASLTGMIRSAR